jgi:DNA-directed RNA polymerase specialized sigma24 family protein
VSLPPTDAAASRPPVEDLDELQGDEALVAALVESGFTGPLWDRFIEALARYSYHVVRSWVYSMTIFTRAREKNVKNPGPPRGGRHLSLDDASEIANEVVAHAIIKFRDKVLRAGLWSPDGGASLKTMFLNQCIYQFPNVYKRWLRETESPSTVELEASASMVDTSPEGDPASLVMLREEVIEALSRVVKNDRDRATLQLLAEGYSNAEIAEMLNATTKAIESALYRHRDQLRSQRQRPGERTT